MQLRLRIILLLIGGLLILINHLYPINFNNQVTLLLIVLFVLGIPHGALDFFIDKKIQNTQGMRHTLVFFGKYFSNMAIYAFIWYYLPTLAILIFIALTAYHFGEIDWIGKAENKLHQLMYFVLGLSWILFLLSKNIHSAIEIFMLLGQSKIEAEKFYAIAKTIFPITQASLIIIHIILFFSWKFFFTKPINFFYAVIQIGCLNIINLALPLWLCFAFYFGIWHSILSFDKIRQEFDIQNTIKGWLSLLYMALPYSLLAWIGIGLFIKYALQTLDMAHFLPLLFIGIAVLALPHLQVFTKVKLKETTI
ncbi:MAG: Brp/Blh family beta-carotene 15,15'-dioxygenase [Sediminibacterium sp.]|jgi:Brp/Blh family beta-carotene 15,15'-monooxygenase|nr:Brp/Blh family beta-carotene 15,15'-dioxygenase [Sediminibacterium sp.]